MAIPTVLIKTRRKYKRSERPIVRRKINPKKSRKITNSQLNELINSTVLKGPSSKLISSIDSPYLSLIVNKLSHGRYGCQNRPYPYL